MENTDNILQELKQISPFVADLTRANPYQAPQGYFEGLAEEILYRVKALDNSSFTLHEAAHINPFAAPPDYFENVSNTVISRIRAMESSSPKEELEALSPVLGKLDKKIPFSLPPGYFDELSIDVLAGANAIDFVNRQFDLSPLLNEAKNKNVYTAPTGYFDKLAEQVIKKARRGQGSTLISLNVNKRLVNYLTAAVITGVMAVGTWLFFQPEPSPRTKAQSAAIENVSDDEIVNYLNNNPIHVTDNSTAYFDMKEEDVKELLSDVSDQELQQYLDQHGEAKDVTIN